MIEPPEKLADMLARLADLDRQRTEAVQRVANAQHLLASTEREIAEVATIVKQLLEAQLERVRGLALE